MKGLTYIRKDIFHMTVSWLSKVIEVSRQGVTDWESGRSNLSTNRLSTLEKIFGVSSEWYYKEINKIDKLKIDNEVLTSIMTNKINVSKSVHFYENPNSIENRNIHFEKTTADLETILHIKDIQARNDYILKQIAKNQRQIQLLECNYTLNAVGNEFISNPTNFGLFINCLSAFENIVNKIKQEDKQLIDIKLANLKQYLINYKNINN